jgi:hypothetical protein
MIGRWHSAFVVSSLLAACSGDGEPPRETNIGIITATRQEDVWYGFAGYWEPVKTSCDAERVGGCLLQRPCQTQRPIEQRTFDAGTVAIQGSVLPFEGDYYSGPLTDRFGAGAMVEMSATGSGDVPAHRGSVVVPEAVVPEDPSFDAPVAIERSRDFPVSWTPVPVGSVSVTIAVLTEPSPHSLICQGSAADGRLSVPSEALAGLPATSEAAPGSVTITQSHSLSLRPPGWEIYLSIPGLGTTSTSAEID